MSPSISSPARPLLTLALALALAACKQDSPPATSTAPPVEPAPVPAESDIKPATSAVEATDENIAAAEKSIEEAADAARKKWVGKTFEEFEASVYKEPGEGGKYIVNGDIAIPDRKLLQEFFEKMQKEADGVANGKLTVALAAAKGAAGGVDIWTSEKKKQLTYCVSNAFGTHKAAVIADMEAASRSWEEAAKVDFIHVPAQDAGCNANNPNVLFDVRPVDVDGEYLARAFFPSDQRNDRNVLIDNSSFDLVSGEPLQLVGILRHELGHTLGLRHEHTRPEAGTCFEDDQFEPLTAYDKFSVMHYPQCNGGGDWSLVLTGLDKAGSACLYGKGSNNPENLAQCIYHAPDAPATGTVETKTFDNQSVAKGAKKQYGPFALKAGSIAQVKMLGVGSNAGDPDLYVRYVGPPDTSSWICRPYLSHANETCELEVPANRTKIYVMVRGYAAGNYKLEITYTKPN
jgi:serine protease